VGDLQQEDLLPDRRVYNHQLIHLLQFKGRKKAKKKARFRTIAIRKKVPRAAGKAPKKVVKMYV